MKKILAIALALVMALALSVTAFADEVILSEDTMFFSNGNWNEYDTEIGTDAFYAALQTPGAYLVFTRDTAATDVLAYGNGGWEKFLILDSWWSGTHTKGDESTSQWIALGTANHTIAMAVAGGQPYDVDIDCVLDDGIKAWYDCADILAIWEAGAYNTTGGGDVLHLISNSSPDDQYKIINVSVVVPAEPIVVEEETPAVEEEPAVEETPADDTPAVEEPKEEKPADTGLALAVVPMIVAAAAVVLSKKR